MFNKLRIGKKGENIIFGTFVLLYIGWCVNSPDMNIESLKSVLTIGLSVGIIYGLVALGISLIYTGLDVVNFSHGEFFICLLYTSPSPRDRYGSRMPSSA